MFICHQNVDLALTLAMSSFIENPCTRLQFYESRDAEMFICHQNVDLALTLAMSTFIKNPYTRMKIL